MDLVVFLASSAHIKSSLIIEIMLIINRNWIEIGTSKFHHQNSRMRIETAI